MNQVFDVFGRRQRPVDVATDPVEGQGFVSTELTGELQEGGTKAVAAILKDGGEQAGGDSTVSLQTTTSP